MPIVALSLFPLCDRN